MLSAPNVRIALALLWGSLAAGGASDTARVAFLSVDRGADTRRTWNGTTASVVRRLLFYVIENDDRHGDAAFLQFQP